MYKHEQFSLVNAIEQWLYDNKRYISSCNKICKKDLNRLRTLKKFIKEHPMGLVIIIGNARESSV